MYALPQAEPQNEHVYAGDDFTLAVTLYNASGNLATLTGVTFEWRLFDAYTQIGGCSAVAAFRSSASGDITASGAVASIVVPGTDTTDLRGVYTWQLRATDGDGNSGVVAHGELFVAYRATGTV